MPAAPEKARERCSIAGAKRRILLVDVRRIFFPVPYLGGHKDVLPFDGSIRYLLAYRLTNLRFVLVQEGSIDMTVSRVDGRLDCLNTVISQQLQNVDDAVDSLEKVLKFPPRCYSHCTFLAPVLASGNHCSALRLSLSPTWRIVKALGYPHDHVDCFECTQHWADHSWALLSSAFRSMYVDRKAFALPKSSVSSVCGFCPIISQQLSSFWSLPF